MRRILATVIILSALVGGLLLQNTAQAVGPCDAPVNPIVAENCLPGNPVSEWDVSGDWGGAGSSNIQGFATEFSVNKGQTVGFKVKTAASSYRLDIYRMGYYNGSGARKITTVNPSASLPQSQPNCITNASVGLIDCGNWAQSASWAIPSTATSGVYFAKLVRTDATAGASHIYFIVRNDTGGADLLLKTSDTTWQAYNKYGGASLYVDSVFGLGRALKVSYNRPFITRFSQDGLGPRSFLFNNEYPMIRWLERNGYNMSYISSVDTASSSTVLSGHKAMLSVGHDEYWSGEQRTNVENARNNGVSLAFFSGNEVFWKTRWETSPVTGSAFKTMVTYKETHANAKVDPSSQWTGSWRDPRFSPPSDGGRPENALTGTIFTVNGTVYNDLRVSAEEGKLRLWRNTSVANLGAGQTATIPTILGHEWDEELDNGFRPAGLIRLSRSTHQVPNRVTDYGSTYAPGPATHSLTLYKHPSGALVFGAGTVQWSWGLDAVHDRDSFAPVMAADVRVQQATVNLLADMGALAGSVMPGLTASTQTADVTAPTATITSPASGTTHAMVPGVTVSGTAADVGGRVGGVEISTDGSTWHPATTGRDTWSYTFMPTGIGSFTIRARATDDSGNIGGLSNSVVITVQCPCNVFGDKTPGVANYDGAASVEVGAKLFTNTTGFITGVRFYKGHANTGTHTGSLWNTSGTRLATVTFTNESAYGWQHATFPSPIAIAANTTYIISYHTNRYFAWSNNFFATGITNGPLTMQSSVAASGNGVYAYAATSVYPNQSFGASNYWVDATFRPSSIPAPAGQTIFGNATPQTAALDGGASAELGVKFQSNANGFIKGVRFYKGTANTGTHTGALWSAASGAKLADVTFANESASGWQQALFATPVPVSANTTYIASYHTPRYFAHNPNFFGAATVNGPLTALASGTSGGNGVYTYSATVTLPTSTYQFSNYWVDVIYDTQP